jgi:hypothetical protein
MEGANEAARRAVNALLDRAGSTETRTPVYEAWQPDEWTALRRMDDQRYAQGQPNLFDTGIPLGELKALLSGAGLGSLIARG